MILSIVKNAIQDPNLVLNYRVSEKHFTRVRKQTFSTTLLFMMNFLCKSHSLEIENFIKYIHSTIGLVSFSNFTKSAFVQCRSKIQPGVFKHLSKKLVDEFYTDNEGSVKRWNGFDYYPLMDLGSLYPTRMNRQDYMEGVKTNRIRAWFKLGHRCYMMC